MHDGDMAGLGFLCRQERELQPRMQGPFIKSVKPCQRPFTVTDVFGTLVSEKSVTLRA